MNKKPFILSLVLTAVILGGCIMNSSFLILAAVGVICASMVFFSMREATCLLLFFSPLSYVLVYQQYNIYILLAVSYIFAALLKRKNMIGVVAAFFIISYSILFASSEVSVNIGRFIHPLLLLLLIFVCQCTAKKDYGEFFTYFLIGFIISAIIGFFKDQIPMIQGIFASDALYINGVETSLDIIRYSGLSYDPNFFTLIDCMLISILLFADGKINLLKGIALMFLIVIGFFTFSKSYVILLAVIGVVYILKNNRRPVRTFFLLLAAFVCLVIAEKYSGIKILSLIEARFESADGINDLTTGRLDLWKEYLIYISGNIRCLVFGEGFNALSLRKAVHNTYIDFIYRFGLIGTGLWIAYFAMCKKIVDRAGKEKTHFNITGFVFLAGIFFLSAFHFHQLWCCIFFALIAPYVNGGKYEKVKCDCPDI